MRWNEQRVTQGAAQLDQAFEPSALPGLELAEVAALPGHLRTVRTPEFAGAVFHEVLAKSALNKVPQGSSMPFSWTINPYRGCSHACVYCFARGSHRYLDFDTGKDFDSQIVVKVNVAEVLGRELAKPSWQRETVALGTNTDPYQRAEGRYKLMPGIIEQLARSRTPFSILTKGTLLRRDLPALVDAADRVRVHLAMSIAVGDPELQQSIEPGTPTTKARLDTIAAARDAGFEPDVFVMPVLPHLTDSPAHLNALLRDIRDAGARSVQYGALHLRSHVKPWFFAWLEREHPELLPQYRKLYPGASSKATQAYRIDLAARIRPLIRRYGLEPQRGSGRSRDPYPPMGSATTTAGQAAPMLNLFETPSIEAPGAPAPTLF
ncbi:Rv2578c family radical SAM protein [Leucobacter denitrificans]|uniref:Rv2578c family radical SAM protein n=1 Tax=Leucobacter denitrificans TaxID=683042 RepID=A0A7G9S397_9MICO|nr:Rv2578c family radical SAM protein [Leucobacter denitrificans]QNN62322.1 Rv2578c family radical SAM protein [Leucobacter denitrificans]